MAEVIFDRIAPVLTVHDIEAALARYRRLGFATELDASAQYGFAERGAVQLHLQPTTRTTRAAREASSTSTSPTLMPYSPSGRQQVSKVGSLGRTTVRTVCASLCTSIPTASFVASARRSKDDAWPKVTRPTSARFWSDRYPACVFAPQDRCPSGRLDASIARAGSEATAGNSVTKMAGAGGRRRRRRRRRRRPSHNCELKQLLAGR